MTKFQLNKKGKLTTEEKEKVKTFKFGGKNFKVHLRLATEDTAVFADKDYYKKYCHLFINSYCHFSRVKVLFFNM